MLPVPTDVTRPASVRALCENHGCRVVVGQLGLAEEQADEHEEGDAQGAAGQHRQRRHPPRRAHDGRGDGAHGEGDQAVGQGREAEGGLEEQIGDQAGEEADHRASLGTGHQACAQGQDEQGLGVHIVDPEPDQQGGLQHEHDDEDGGDAQAGHVRQGWGAHWRTVKNSSLRRSTRGLSSTSCCSAPGRRRADTT